jgi:ABC-type sugar transport system permease subunit
MCLCVERLRAEERNTPGRQRVNTCFNDSTGNYQAGCTMTVYKMDPFSPPHCYCSCVCRIVQYYQPGRSNLELPLSLFSSGVMQPYGSEKYCPNFSWIHLLKLSCRITWRIFKFTLKYTAVHMFRHCLIAFFIGSILATKPFKFRRQFFFSFLSLWRNSPTRG